MATTSHGEAWKLPDRATVLARLEDLIAERRSREEVSNWAAQFTCGAYDHIRVTDFPAWEMLQPLMGCDTIISVDPTEYLYDKIDFENWREELRAADK